MNNTVFIDTCTLENFAVVDRLDLLKARFDGRAIWTATIKFEIERGLSSHPHLRRVLDAGWLGEPLEVDGDLVTIDRVRRGLMDGKPPNKAMDHLGEAEVIYLLGTRAPSSSPTTGPRRTSQNARDTEQSIRPLFCRSDMRTTRSPVPPPTN